MNGKPLRPEHGFPFRVVVPGYSGARWVKWVDQITVSQKESENFYQQRDYKVLPPEVSCSLTHPLILVLIFATITPQVETHEQAEAYWSKVPPLLANPLNSVIASANIDHQHLHVNGYAVGESERQVKKVSVSVDEGTSWWSAKITYQEGRWSWTLWEATVPLPDGKTEYHGKVYSRAEDESGNQQSRDTDWNLRGVAYSGFGEQEF
jgi:sulfite oxidase